MSQKKLSGQHVAHSEARDRVEVVRDAVGCHPCDLLIPIGGAADALSWLEEIFNVIKESAVDGGKAYRVKRLAAAGAYLASDYAGWVSVEHERLRDSLIASGCMTPGVDQSAATAGAE